MKKLFTSESVTEGHPDKICDRISDSVLDALITDDPDSRVACETFVTTGIVTVMGEITTKAYVDIDEIVRRAVCDIGYNDASFGFDGNTCGVLNAIHEQSPDIALGVDRSAESKAGDSADPFETGAGDQGLMFGFACDETKEFMPLSISLSHRLAKMLASVRKDGTLPYLRPDGKTQVTVEYKGDVPIRVDTVVVSTQHSADVPTDQIKADVIKYVINEVVDPSMIDGETKIFVNPTGRFVVGGPMGDTGLTGRKIIVDTYGGYARHGGGCFSGKDPTKVDRSAAYMARYLAKNVVASGIAKRCEVQLAYAIGVANPVSVMVDTFGTSDIPDTDVADYLVKTVDMRPGAIISRFDLKRPIYTPLSAYGHMGREDLGVPWESVDLTDGIKYRFK